MSAPSAIRSSLAVSVISLQAVVLSASTNASRDNFARGSRTEMFCSFCFSECVQSIALEYRYYRRQADKGGLRIWQKID